MNETSVLMVVEDDVHIRSIIRDILEYEGYRVNEASNGAEALTALTTDKPDLILLDLQMPVMSGWTFMQALQKARTDVPVIIMSAQMNSVERARQLGAVDCLSKPFELVALLDIVAKYAGSSQDKRV
ncbi:MAG: response regulator [Chloroflexia bacterium]